MCPRGQPRGAWRRVRHVSRRRWGRSRSRTTPGAACVLSLLVCTAQLPRLSLLGHLTHRSPSLAGITSNAMIAVEGSAVGCSPIEGAIAVVAIGPVCIPLRAKGGSYDHVGVRPLVLLAACNMHYTQRARFPSFGTSQVRQLASSRQPCVWPFFAAPQPSLIGSTWAAYHTRSALHTPHGITSRCSRCGSPKSWRSPRILDLWGTHQGTLHHSTTSMHTLLQKGSAVLTTIMGHAGIWVELAGLEPALGDAAICEHRANLDISPWCSRCAPRSCCSFRQHPCSTSWLQLLCYKKLQKAKSCQLVSFSARHPSTVPVP